MATQRLGKLGVLDILLAGDTANLKRATKEGATHLEKMGAVARSAVTSIAKISAAIAAASVAIFALTKRVANAGDEFAKMSAKVGASVEFLSAFAHSAKLGGVESEGLTQSLGRMARVMSDAQNGLATAKRSFEDLGVKVEDADGSLREVPDVLLEVADQIAGMTDQTKQAALAQEIFGRSGLELLPVLKQGSAAIREQMEEAKRLGIVWSTENAKAAEEFNDNVERLGRGVEGLSIKLANPLIRRLGETAGAMLEAQKRGEGFFSTIAEGFGTMVAGHGDPMTKEVFLLTDKLIRLQDIGDQLRNRPVTPMNTRFIELNAKAIDETKAKLKELVDFRTAVVPQPPAAAPSAPAAVAPRGLTDAEKKAEEERKLMLGEQFQWEIDEEQRVLDEIGAIHIAAHEKRLEDEKQRQADLQAAKIAGYDWEQEQAIAQGEELLAIDKAIAEQKKAQREGEKQAQAKFMSDLGGLMNTGSKKMFELGKIAALSQAGIDLGEGVMSAWKWGNKIGGPYVGAAFAAAAGLAGLNLMNNIRSQQFGGGGGTPVAPTQGASGVSPVGAGGGGQQSQQQSMTHIISGLNPNDLFSGRQIRKLLNEGVVDGDRVVIAE